MSRAKRIAFVSGKGGAGKTTLAVNLSVAAAASGMDVLYVDCDVEEPDGHIFLKPAETEVREVSVSVPVVDEDSCDGCGRCADICRFNAIKVLAGLVVSFPELCHSCGGCTLACPQGAISEVRRRTGRIVAGVSTVNTGSEDPGRLDLIMGELDIGEARAVPVIEDLAARIDGGDIVFIDAPPGTSCPMVAVVREADYVVLVAEASPFGLHDLELAAEVVSILGVPSGLVMNRVMADDGPEGPFCPEKIREHCRGREIELLDTIPAERKIAEISSDGRIASREIPSFGRRMRDILATVLERAGGAD